MSNSHARKLGHLGGLSRSPLKSRASAMNGEKGGRPPSVRFSDWNLFFDRVDEVRRTRSIKALSELFSVTRSERSRALIHATTRVLCGELGLPIPSWARRAYRLKEPYFVSGIENLKATALLESPIEYKSNNVFVLENFLKRV